jgi:Ca2+-binding RTX toxin-like protein
VFKTSIAGPANVDIIGDFTAAADWIQLDSTVFVGLPLGTLDASLFAVGSATGSSPEIVYDGVSGALYYDSNGAGAGGATQFATLTGAPALTAANFQVV